MAKKIRLTESDLHNLVECAVMNVLENEELNEGWKDYFRSIKNDTGKVVKSAYDTATDKLENTPNNFKRKFDNAVDNVKQRYNNAMQGFDNAVDNVKQRYNNAMQGLDNTVDRVKQGVKNIHNRAMDASAIGDIPSAIKTLNNVKNRNLIPVKQLKMVNGAISILKNIYAQMKQGQA